MRQPFSPLHNESLWKEGSRELFEEVIDRVTGLKWHCIEARALYGDTDRADVVNHASYLRYLEMARVSLFRQGGKGYREVEAEGIYHPIVSLGVDYHKALQFDDLMRIYVRPAELKLVTFTFDYRIIRLHDHELAAGAFTRHCCITDQKLPTRIDVHTLELFRRYGLTQG